MIDAGTIANFHAANKSDLFKFKQKITGKTGDSGTKDAEIMVSLKYLSNFWRTFEMALINFEINLILTWSDKSVLFNSTKVITFIITDTELYVPVVTLSTQDNEKLFQQSKSDFRRSIIGTNINLKYQYKHQTHISIN